MHFYGILLALLKQNENHEANHTFHYNNSLFKVMSFMSVAQNKLYVLWV